MAVIKNDTGKGMDIMSLWQQHYYTWSTKSLSGNKVGLGIVAASDKNRDYLRIAGTEGAKCEACRTEEGIMVERMSYSSELHGFIRTGTVPCKQSADQRNNKFVHIQSSAWNNFSYPEDYLCPLCYKESWDGEEKLVPLSISEKRIGRFRAVAILKKYGLENQLSSLLYSIYHCMLTSEKPLMMVDASRSPEEFASFSREMMILIHYMLPEHLRKEADYVSYVSENTQEAHFLFGRESYGMHCFVLGQKAGKREYTLLEKEFFAKLAEIFMKETEEYDSVLKRIDQILTGLNDKRNQLEKCILSLMAPYACKEKKKDNYFTSMERLMYWARKDKSLLGPLKKSISSLDFHGMEEGELLSYTKLLLTGAGGETKQTVFEELSRMLAYFYKDDRTCFKKLLNYIRENHGKMYEEILRKNTVGDSFTRDILFMPVRDIHQLEQAVKYHKSFFEVKEYKKYLVTRAYELYKQAGDEKLQSRIGQLGKQVDEDAFVSLKLNDVKKIMEQADSRQAFLKAVEQMDLQKLEKPIQEFLYVKSVYFLKKKEKMSVQEEGKFFAFAEELEMTSDMEQEIISHYRKELEPWAEKMTVKKLAAVPFEENGAEEREKETACYLRVRNDILAEKYIEFTKTESEAFFKLSVSEWIRFVLKVSGALEKENPKAAKNMIRVTKKLILSTDNIFLLAEVNHILRNYGTALIHCTESMWSQVEMNGIEDLQKFQVKVAEISLVRCDRSPVYQKTKELYQYADAFRGRPEEKAVYAWKQYDKKHRNDGVDPMESNRWNKLLHYAVSDILSKSVWAVLLGFYGFLFVTIREEIAVMPGYIPSIAILIILVIIYGAKTFLGRKEPETPGAFLYIMGVGILLMNWGLALDTIPGIAVLYVVSLALSIAAKVAHYVIFTRQKDETEK